MVHRALHARPHQCNARSTPERLQRLLHLLHQRHNGPSLLHWCAASHIPRFFGIDCSSHKNCKIAVYVAARRRRREKRKKLRERESRNGKVLVGRLGASLFASCLKATWQLPSLRILIDLILNLSAFVHSAMHLNGKRVTVSPYCSVRRTCRSFGSVRENIMYSSAKYSTVPARRISVCHGYFSQRQKIRLHKRSKNFSVSARRSGAVLNFIIKMWKLAGVRIE